MKYLLLLVLVFANYANYANDKKMNAKPSNKGEIKLEKRMKVMDDEGFYESILSTVSPNGEYVVYDNGNKLLFIFNSDGSVKSSFGKEGTGPGEFNRVRDLLANDDKIYVRSGRKFMIFNYSGSLVREITEHISFRGTPVLFADRFSMFYPNSKYQKFYRVDYSLDGKTLKTYKNGSYDPATATERRRRMNPDRMKEMFTAPTGLIKTEKGFVRYYPGEYKFERLDEKFKSNIVVTRDYDRIKEFEDPEWMKRWKQRAGNNKRAQERRARVMQARTQITGGILSDISNILGVVNGYLFIQTSANNKNTVNIDVVSPKNELFDQLTIKGDEVISARIANGKLLINYTNNDDGPYLVSYNIDAGQDHLVKK